MEKSRLHLLNTFVLKVIAMITMTFDHIGKCIQFFYLKGIMNLELPQGMMSYVFQIIGRLTLPLIAICFAEAMRHTRSREDYLKRLGIMTMIVMIVEIVFEYAMNMNWGTNIFLTILCSAAFIYFYEAKNNKKLFCVIPVLVILLSLANQIVFNFSDSGRYFLPSFLRADYSIYGFILFVGFYFIYKFSDYRVTSIASGTGKSLEELRQYPYYRTFTNLMWIALLLVLNVFFWILSYINTRFNFYDAGLQAYSLIASILIILYNGKKGYSSNKTKYAFYFYYPIHLLIIMLAFYFAVGL